MGLAPTADGASKGVFVRVVALPALCYNRARPMDAVVPFSAQRTIGKRFRVIAGASAGNPKSLLAVPILIRRDGRSLEVSPQSSLDAATRGTPGSLISGLIVPGYKAVGGAAVAPKHDDTKIPLA